MSPRLEALKLAHDSQIRGSTYSPERVIEIAAQYDQYLRGDADTPQGPAARPKVDRRKRT